MLNPLNPANWPTPKKKRVNKDVPPSGRAEYRNLSSHDDRSIPHGMKGKVDKHRRKKKKKRRRMAKESRRKNR